MKNINKTQCKKTSLLKTIGSIAFTALLVFSMTACNTTGNSKTANNSAVPVSGVSDQRGKATQGGLRGFVFGLLHPSLPFGTRVTVTNTSNGRTAEASVFGSIPESPNRIADLSEALWYALDLTPDTDIIISTGNDTTVNVMPKSITGNFQQYGGTTQEMNAEGLCIAHPSLSLGIKVMVYNVRNGREVEATVVGRIPASSNRIADVSKDVWQELELTPDIDVVISGPVLTTPE